MASYSLREILKMLRTPERRFPSHGISAGQDGLVTSLCSISRFLVFGIPNAASRPFAPRQRRESSPTQRSKDGDLISRCWRSLVLSTIRSASFPLTGSTTPEVMFDRSITYGFLEIHSEFELISELANTAFKVDFSEPKAVALCHGRLQSSLNLR